MAESDPGGRLRPARWSGWAAGRVLLVVAVLVASVGVVSAQPVAAAVRWLQVDAGGFHTCGIREGSAGAGMGTLWCWGLNSEGQLGLGDRNKRSVPTQVGKDADWVMVTAGDMHTCALKGAGKARFCWGDNSSGLLGLGTDGAKDNRYRRYLSPTAGGDSGWESLSAGVVATCGIRTQYLLSPLPPPGQLTIHKNRLLCWGDNFRGELGVDSRTRAVVSPTPIAGGGQWTEVSLGREFGCGLRSDGQVPGERYCWGQNEDAQLGIGERSVYTSPVMMPTAVPGDGAWSTVTTGAYHACGISVNRRAYCWGSRGYGALGLGEFDPDVDGCCLLAPETRLPGTSWARIYAGGVSTCGLTTNGTRLCWGRNNVGQLGVGDYQDRYSPAQPQGPEEGPVWASLTLDAFHGCGIQKTGALFCWGYNGYGQLGSSRVPVGEVRTLPVPVG